MTLPGTNAFVSGMFDFTVSTKVRERVLLRHSISSIHLWEGPIDTNKQTNKQIMRKLVPSLDLSIGT